MNSEEKTGVRRPRPESAPTARRKPAQRKKSAAPQKGKPAPTKRRPIKDAEPKKRRNKAAEAAAERRRRRSRVVPADTGKQLGLSPEEVVAREAAALMKLRNQ